MKTMLELSTICCYELSDRKLQIISGEVIRLPRGASLPVTLKVLEYELFHFCPLKVNSFSLVNDLISPFENHNIWVSN